MNFFFNYFFLCSIITKSYQCSFVLISNLRYNVGKDAFSMCEIKEEGK